MQRWALGIEYEGTNFYGWQKQLDANPYIQSTVESALSAIACEPIRVVVAGRTDRGVHALRQVVHFDTAVERPVEAWVLGANTRLPKTIRIQWAITVPPTFDARKSAIARRYRYILSASQEGISTLHRHVTCMPRLKKLDVAGMHEAAQALIGEHDFSAFRDSQCQARHPVRVMKQFSVYCAGRLVVFDVTANAFLHHMVRNLVGSLLRVGVGMAPREYLRELLICRDRRLAGPTAPPEGLYLVDVVYAHPTVIVPSVPLGPDFVGLSPV